MSALEHPVTEFAFLNILPPTTLDTPKLATGFLREVVAQSSWSGYQLQFFHSTQESNGAAKTILYILSGWASVQAHNEWIASSESQELLKYFGDAGMMSVGGLAHLDIDFTKLSFEQCAAIVWRKMDGGDVSGSDCTKVRVLLVP
jgi:heme-degrading monooxygenase HmoA